MSGGGVGEAEWAWPALRLRRFYALATPARSRLRLGRAPFALAIQVRAGWPQPGGLASGSGALVGLA